MMKMRTYIVSFCAAEKTEQGFSVLFSQLAAGEKHQISASCYPDLERGVRLLAREYGRDCCPYIRLPLGERKPPGFDAFCNTLRFIETMPALIG